MVWSAILLFLATSVLTLARLLDGRGDESEAGYEMSEGEYEMRT